MLKILNKFWYSWKVWSFIILLIILMMFKIVSAEADSVHDYDRMKNSMNNRYNPVRMTDNAPEGVVDEDKNGRKKAEAVFYIKNHTNQNQKVTFLLYQHNVTTHEVELFNLEHVYTCFDANTKSEIENGVLTIPGGETMQIHVEGVARNYSKVQISEISPYVKIIKLN